VTGFGSEPAFSRAAATLGPAFSSAQVSQDTASIIANASHAHLLRFGNKAYFELWEKNVEMKYEIAALR
jgi:hypothetical protein